MIKFARHTTLSAAAIALSCGGSVRADQTLQGAIGLPLNPTAQLPPKDLVETQATYYDLGSLSLAGIKISDEKYYGLQAAGRLLNRLEVSGGFSRIHASDPLNLGLSIIDKTTIDIGAKYLLTSESHKNLQVAVGVGYDRSLLRNTSAYLVADKSFALTGSLRPTMHLGLRHDHFSTAFFGGPASSKYSVFGGLELPVDRAGNLALVGEIQTKNNDLGRESTPYSLGVRYRVPKCGLTASAGVQRFGVFDGGGVYAKIGYAFNNAK